MRIKVPIELLYHILEMRCCEEMEEEVSVRFWQFYLCLEPADGDVVEYSVQALKLTLRQGIEVG